MDIEPLKDAFWAIVVDCLVEFHGMALGEASSAIDTLRALLAIPLPGGGPTAPWESELFYHNEPLYVAGDIAGREADADAVAAKYEAIQDRHYGPAEQIAFGPAFRASSLSGAG